MVMVLLGVMFGRDESTADEKIEKAFETIVFLALLPSAISFYTFYYFLFPRYFSKKKYISTAILGIATSYIAGILGFIFLFQIHKENTCAAEGENVFIGMTLFMGFIALICGVIGLVIRGFITWFEEVKQREELSKKNHEMEMALVKSQLDPHFLFNTINNIDVLILRDANKASDYLNHLSEIMRFMLFETKTDLIPLKKEVEYIKKYIELQRIRTANELYVNFNIDGDTEKKAIAPMVFIPFIENAFKHTNNKKVENAITISIEIKATQIIMSCENKYDPTRPPRQESNGLGNNLIVKRLSLIYPNSHDLSIENENNTYAVTLTINHA